MAEAALVVVIIPASLAVACAAGALVVSGVLRILR
jgi:hypothetical protein